MATNKDVLITIASYLPSSQKYRLVHLIKSMCGTVVIATAHNMGTRNLKPEDILSGANEDDVLDLMSACFAAALGVEYLPENKSFLRDIDPLGPAKPS